MAKFANASTKKNISMSLTRHLLSSEIGRSFKELPKSFAPPSRNDGAFQLVYGGVNSYAIDFLDGVNRSDADLVNRYRAMNLHHEVMHAVEAIVNEAIVIEGNRCPVNINLDSLDTEESTKKKLREVFVKAIKLLNFTREGDEIFKTWYIDGKIYFHKIVDPKDLKKGIIELRYIDAQMMSKRREYITERNANGVDVYVGERVVFVYSDMYDVQSASGVEIPEEAVIHVPSGLYDPIKRRSVGYLHPAIKPLNQLRMMEDATVIYRMSRAPERRVYYIDLTGVQRTKAEEYMRETMQRHRSTLNYDSATGEIADDARFLSMMEDIWLPRTGPGGKSTEVQQLSGGMNLGKMEDVEYFKDRFYRSLFVPKSRINPDQNTYNYGQVGTTTLDEINFSKTIRRLRNKFAKLFVEIIKTECVLKNICTDEEFDQEIAPFIFFEWVNDNYYAESKNQQLYGTRFKNAIDAEPMVEKGYVSRQWIKKNILMQDDHDMEELSEQIEQEKVDEMILQTKTAERLAIYQRANSGQGPFDPDPNDQDPAPNGSTKPAKKFNGRPRDDGNPPRV